MKGKTVIAELDETKRKTFKFRKPTCEKCRVAKLGAVKEKKNTALEAMLERERVEIEGRKYDPHKILARIIDNLK